MTQGSLLLSLQPLLQVALGGAIATLASLITVRHEVRIRREEEKRNLKAAFASEISALLAVVGARHYIPQLESTIDTMEKTGAVQTFAFRVTKPYFNIYEQNASKIGVLDSCLSRKIPEFYTFSFAIVEDLEFLLAKGAQLDLQVSLTFHKELLAMFKRTRELGSEIADNIDKKTGK